MLKINDQKNELKRLQAIQDLNLLDTPPEERFDRITRLAMTVFDVPFSLLTVVDADRQWFKSAQGLSATETNGGKVIAPAFDVPNVGRMGIIADPTGGVIGVLTPPAQG